MSIGIRKALKLAEDHAIGILESTDDSAFWGEDFFDAHEDDWRILAQAKAAVLKRITCAKGKRSLNHY